MAKSVTALTLLSGGADPALSVEPVVAAEEDAASTCDVLLLRIQRSNNWLDAFNVLIFAVALASAAMLVVAVLNAANSDVVTAIVSGVGAVLGSGAFTGLIKLKGSQQDELDRYLALRTTHNCPEN